MALQENTANLPSVRIVEPESCIGRSSVPCIQSGLYYGQLGALQEIIAKIKQEAFKEEPPFIIGTGGFAALFEEKNVFDVIIPDLVLHGVYLALQMKGS